MKGAVKRISVDAAYIVAVVGITLAVWAISAAAVDSEFVLPSIGATFASFGDVLRYGAFWSGLSGTLSRCLIGFVVSFALFVVAFMLSVASPHFARMIDPVVSALRSLPAVAVTLILVLAVGGYGAPVVLGVLVIMPIMYSSARARVATMPKELSELCLLWGASNRQKLNALWFPCLASGLPEILSTAFSYNIKAVVGAEILAQTSGSLGMLMKIAQSNLQTAMLVAYVVAAVVVSVIAEAVIRLGLRAALKRFD